jgi:predicted Zn-dependent peptidase
MKQRVSAAIDSQDADWNAQAMRFFKKSYFGPMNSPYQFMPIGTKPNVAKFTPDDLRKFYGERVLHARRVLAVYGDVDLATAERVAKQRLGGGDPVSKDKPAPAVVDAEKASNSAKPGVLVDRLEMQRTEQPLAGIIIGYDSASVIGDPANYAIDVADTMCSGYGYPTGYLHETLRGLGYVYVVHAQNWPGRDAKLPGAFFAYAGCQPDKVNHVVDLMLENIARLQGSDEDVQPDWFLRSKELITTSDALDHETPAAQAMQAVLDEMNGLGYDFHEQFAPHINAVKLSAVKAIARQRLTRCVVTISTPAPEIVKVKTGKRTYNNFPPVDLTPRGVQHDAK